MPEGWEWDETLYLGSAPFYANGRLPYAPELANRLAQALSLDGRGRLIDVGCGPGTVTLLLAHLFEESIGIDPDSQMLAEAERRAVEARIVNMRWMRLRGEDLPADLGTFRVATFAQSFHWMDRDRVAAIVLNMLEPGGALVHISDAKAVEPSSDEDLPYPAPPHDGIRQLVRKFLGPVRRAGKGELRHGTPDDEAVVLLAAGFQYPDRLQVPGQGILVRSVDDLVAWVYSLSSSAPHLFGDGLDAFESFLRRMLHDASPSGLFAERLPDTEVFIWRTASS